LKDLALDKGIASQTDPFGEPTRWHNPSLVNTESLLWQILLPRTCHRPEGPGQER